MLINTGAVLGEQAEPTGGFSVVLRHDSTQGVQEPELGVGEQWNENAR